MLMAELTALLSASVMTLPMTTALALSPALMLSPSAAPADGPASAILASEPSSNFGTTVRYDVPMDASAICYSPPKRAMSASWSSFVTSAALEKRFFSPGRLTCS